MSGSRVLVGAIRRYSSVGDSSSMIARRRCKFRSGIARWIQQTRRQLEGEHYSLFVFRSELVIVEIVDYEEGR